MSSESCHFSENSEVTTLDQLRTGQVGVVRGIHTSNYKLMNKLLTMGVVAGTAIEVLCVAPLGDPMQIRALGYKLSLRMSEAACIELVK